jgi:6,7-dimethyl-8-ribityllumazine synthase
VTTKKEATVKIVEIMAGGPSENGRTLAPSAGYNFLVAVSQYNTLITDRLLEGALDIFRSLGEAISSVTVVRVPGALELPFVIRRAAGSGQFDGALALGCVIRGETGHYDVVVSGVTQGLVQLNSEGQFPVVFGILTTDTLLQALDRVGGKAGHKGREGASTLVTMAGLARALDQKDGTVRP